jgi:hypothetical protein
MTGLIRLAGAVDAEGVAHQAVSTAVEVTAARAGALGVQHGTSVVLLDSVGYDCEAMAAGAVLPLDAGLPLTECVRTGRTTVRGQTGGAMWIAVPLTTPMVRGALLVSLTPASTANAAPLEILADATSAALSRLEPASNGEVAPSTTPLQAPPDW